MIPNSIRRFLPAVALAALAPAICGLSRAQTTPVNPSPVNFLAADVYQNNGHPNQSGIAGLAFDDFNGDGNTDIVAVDGSNCVSFFPGDGKGLFGSPVDTCNLPSRDIYWVASGDFNNDGIKDLAVVATSPGTITLMLLQGNGDGTFTYQNSITINHSQEQATDFKVADLNGDKKPDLVVTSTGSGSPGFYSTYVFLWNGNFSFSQSSITGLGGCPHANSLVIADFNDDSHPDLAVSNGACGLHEIDVMLGNGDGTFQSPVPYSTDIGGPSSIAAGDFNGDGKIDLVSVNGAGGTPLNVFMGNGDGTFGAPIDVPSVYDPDYVAVGDFNGDGKDDLIVSANDSRGLSGVQLSTGGGSFTVPVQYAVLSQPTRIYLEDLNGDKRMDWVSISNGSEQFSVVLGTGTGGFPAAIDSFSTPNDAGATDAIVAADFNQDGNLDYATVGWDIYYPGLNISMGDGAGHFDVPVHYTAGNNPNALVAGNFLKGNIKGNKYPDIAVLDQSDGMVTVLLNNGDGTLGTPQSYPVGAGGGAIQTGDFNGDGILDLIVTNSGDGTVSVLLGNGDGTFQPQVVSPSQPGANYLAVGDFDGDGVLDVAVTYWGDPDIEVMLGNGDGSFQAPVSVPGLPPACGLAAGDLNHDGRTDLVLCSGNIPNGTGGSGGAAIYLNNSSGKGNVSFQTPVDYPTDPVGFNGNPLGSGIPRIGDLNNDGNLDIVIPNLNSYVDGTNIGPAILLGRGDGTFVLNPARPAITGANEQDIALGDFNNDGLLDMVVQNYDPSAAFDQFSSTVTTLLGTSGTEVVLTGTPNPATQGESVTFDASVVTSFLGLPIPTGTITFQVGSTSEPVEMVNGAASYSTTALPVGTTIVTAAYSGDKNFIPATSFALSQNVTTGPLTIVTGSLPDAVQNTQYSTSVTASGGVLSYTFSLTNGSVLPAGLTMNSAGVISGTPSVPGTTTFTVQVKDSSPTPQTVTATLSITVASNLQITTTSLQSGVVGNPYSATVMATGGVPSYTFSLASGSALPANLTISAAGVITGTPTATGTTTFTVQLQDSADPAQTTSAVLSITVTSGLSITTTSLVNGIENGSYSASISASGGVPSYTFSLASGSVLPAGLTINAAGLISGTPTAPGTTTFTVQATDSSSPAQTATAVLSITVASNLQITTTSLPNGVVGNSYSATVTATGGNLPETFSLANGSVLPPGLSISATGVITGKPTTTGTTNFTVQVKDSSPTPQTVTANLSITVTPALSIITTTLVNGVQGSPYSASVSATGGVPSYTFSLASGSVLPANLTISAAGLITGTPTAPGTTTFTVQATDSSSPAQTATAVLSITVASNLQIATTSLQNGVVGNSYSATVTATGGNLPETFSLANGTVLPAGLSISAAGAITGKPTATGTTNFTVQVKDSSPTPQTVTANLSITVTPALSITTTTLVNGVQGSPYSASVSASGGVPSYTFSLASGSVLPANLTISAAGLITGTPTAPGTTTFTVQATDSSNPAQTATAVLSITVTSGLTITTTSLPNGAVASPYSSSVSASGGVLPETFSLANGTVLPAGLTISATGVISGTPTAPGTTSFTVQVKDSSPTPQTATAGLSITIGSSLQITTTTLPQGVVGDSYSTTLTNVGGNAPYTFSLASGSALPAGLTISTGGIISGKPTAAGTSTFTVQLKDSTPVTVTANLSITVNAPLAFTTTSLPSINSGVFGLGFYEQVIYAQGGVGPFTFSVLSGTLPPGVTLPGVFSVPFGTEEVSIGGTPAASDSGTYTFTVQVTDSLGDTATQQLSITVGQPSTPLQFTTTSLPNGVVGTAYNASVTATGGNGQYTFSFAGALPGGLTMSSAGVITGTPLAAGVSNFTVQVRDSSATPQTATARLSIFVSNTPVTPLQITTTSLPNFIPGTPYTAAVSATGGVQPYTFSATGLPAGLTISRRGVITGTPLTATTFGFGEVTVQVHDAENPAQTAFTDLTLAVTAPLQITTTSLPNGIMNTAYTATVTATGGTGQYTFSATGLPVGLTMSSSGVITGTPLTGSPSFHVRVQVQDAGNPPQTATASLTLAVAPLLQVATTSLPNGVVGTAYTATVTATGGLRPYTFSATGLPAGLTISSRGVITGTPTTATIIGGIFEPSVVTVEVHDSENPAQTVSTSLNLNVVAPLQITTTSLPAGSTASYYGTGIEVSGGIQPLTFTIISGSLPAGVTMDPHFGFLDGIPTTAGNWIFTVQVQDSSTPAMTVTKTLTIAITSPGGGTPTPGKLAITTTSLPLAGTGDIYASPIGVTGGYQPYAFSVAGGTLPPGLTLVSGTIQGTPTTTGTYNFALAVTDGTGQRATHRLTIRVIPGVRFVTTTLPVATINSPYAANIIVTGGTAPYTYSYVSITTITGPTTITGSVNILPSGMYFTSYGSNGVLGIGGTPTGPAGTTSFIVTVMDANGLSYSQQFNLVVVQ